MLEQDDECLGRVLPSPEVTCIMFSLTHLMKCVCWEESSLSVSAPFSNSWALVVHPTSFFFEVTVSIVKCL